MIKEFRGRLRRVVIEPHGVGDLGLFYHFALPQVALIPKVQNDS
jgi:hypothetical protein